MWLCTLLYNFLLANLRCTFFILLHFLAIDCLIYASISFSSSAAFKCINGIVVALNCMFFQCLWWYCSHAYVLFLPVYKTSKAVLLISCSRCKWHRYPMLQFPGYYWWALVFPVLLFCSFEANTNCVPKHCKGVLYCMIAIVFFAGFVSVFVACLKNYFLFII